MSEQKEFPKRYKNNLPTGFEEGVQSMDTDDIKKKIFECQAHSYEIDKAKDADEKLQAAKELVKDLSAPYSDAQKVETAKLKYCFFVLESRGVDITPE